MVHGLKLHRISPGSWLGCGRGMRGDGAFSGKQELGSSREDREAGVGRWRVKEKAWAEHLGCPSLQSLHNP